MLKYILRRVAYSVPVLLVASLLTFAGIRWIFNPLAQFHGARNAQGLIALKRRELGLDHPLIWQWWVWLSHFVSGNLGTSESSGLRVSSMIWRSLGATLQLAFWATLVSLVAAIGIGVYSAVRQYSAGDYVFTGLSYLGIAMPPFWFGLLAIGLITTWPVVHFHLNGPLLYSGGLHSPGQSGINLDYFRHLALPVLTLTVQTIGSWSRFQRASMLETLNADYVRTARAKGVPRRRVIWKHAFRNALIPLVTVVSIDTAFLFGGLIITEQIFGIAGMGQLFLGALDHRDATVLLAWLFVTATAVILFNLFADIMYGVLDPRIRVT